MTTQSVKDIIQERSGNQCEVLGCSRLDFRGLQHAHIVHRGIGGRNGNAAILINEPRNLALLCCYHHDVLDGRQWVPGLKAEILESLKLKIGWYEWAAEAKEKGIHIGR